MIVNFDEFKKKEFEVKIVKNSILQLIGEFIDNDADFLKNHELLSPYIDACDFEIDAKKGNQLTVSYRYGKIPYIRRHEVVFSEEEYNRLQEFMKNPELYKKSQKYNI